MISQSPASLRPIDCLFLAVPPQPWRLSAPLEGRGRKTCEGSSAPPDQAPVEEHGGKSSGGGGERNRQLVLTLGVRQSAVTMVLSNPPLPHKRNVIFTRVVSGCKGGGDGTAHHQWGGRRGIPNLSIDPWKRKGIKILLESIFITKTYYYPKTTQNTLKRLENGDTSVRF